MPYETTENTASTSTVWIDWCTTGGTAADVWPTWITTGTTATGATDSTTIWVAWNGSAIAGNTVTPEQWQAEQAEVRRRADERLAEQRAATERAKRLLESMLDARQRQQLERDRFFEVIAKGSRRRYRIHHGSHGNVRLMEGDREVTSYCGQPNGVPIEDSMLAQKLQIEHDEEAFLRVANARRIA